MDVRALVKKITLAFWVAVSSLTAFPVPAKYQSQFAGDLQKMSFVWYPFAGLFFGVAAFYLLHAFAFFEMPSVGALLTLALLLIMSRMIFFEAFFRITDVLFYNGTPLKRRRLLKESGEKYAGFAFAFMILLLKLILFKEILIYGSAPGDDLQSFTFLTAVVMMIMVLSRTQIPLLASGGYRFVPGFGGKNLIGSQPRVVKWGVFISFATASVPFFLYTGFSQKTAEVFFLLILVQAALTFLWRLYGVRRFGSVNDDLLYASSEMSEGILLLVAVKGFAGVV